MQKYREIEMVQKRTKHQNSLYKSKETTQNTLQKQRSHQDPYKVLNEKKNKQRIGNMDQI